jgi:hypothetical protein
MKRRPRVKHEHSFQDRLAQEAQSFREAAEKAPPGPQRDLYLKRARQAATASHIDEWLRSPGLQPPREVENLGK